MANQVFNQPLVMTQQAPGNLTLADAGNLSLMVSYVKGAATQNAITASTTQTQAGGAKITAGISAITIATNNDAITLPKAVAGRRVYLINSSGSTIQIFPALGDGIGANAANAAVTMATARTCVLMCPISGTWWGGLTTVL